MTDCVKLAGIGCGVKLPNIEEQVSHHAFSDRLPTDSLARYDNIIRIINGEEQVVGRIEYLNPLLYKKPFTVFHYDESEYRPLNKFEYGIWYEPDSQCVGKCRGMCRIPDDVLL